MERTSQRLKHVLIFAGFKICLLATWPEGSSYAAACCSRARVVPSAAEIGERDSGDCTRPSSVLGAGPVTDIAPSLFLVGR
jgi:hypothetical protein